MKNLLVLLSIFIFSGCAGTNLTGTQYERGDARRAAGAPTYGRVIYVREVTIQGTDSAKYAGTAIGAVVGAAVGSASGGSSSTKVLKSTVLGSAGGIAGSYIGDKVSSEKAQEIIVDHGNNQITTVVQSVEDGVYFKVGDQVMIIGIGGKTRVAPSGGSK